MVSHSSSEKHPQIPGTNAMAWFAVFLFVVFVALAAFLQVKFGTPG